MLSLLCRMVESYTYCTSCLYNEVRQKWMSQHYVNEITGTESNDVLNEVAHKISQKLQQKLSRLHLKQQQSDSFNLDSIQSNLFTLNDLIENELNFNCCICMEMMIAPSKEPILFIPCSHSFCKQCAFRLIYRRHQSCEQLANHQHVHLSDSQHKKCPLCRKKIKSYVANIQLRQLIEKMLQLKQKEAHQIEQNVKDQQTSQRNQEILKFRKDILSQELKNVTREKHKIEEKMTSFQLIIDHLRKEELETKQRLNLVKRELELIEAQLLQKSDEMDKLKLNRKKASSKALLLRNSLDKLKSELDKTDILSLDI